MKEIGILYKNMKIYKIIRKYSSNTTDDEKFIFVGPEQTIVKDILTKIEKNGYQDLSSKEIELLNEHIPYYKKKFGSIIPNNTKFIYAYLLEDDSILTIKRKIQYYLADSNNKDFLVPSQQHLWIQCQNISYDLMVNFINDVFKTNENIKIYDVYKKLQVSLMLDTNDQINTLLKSLFSKKYNDKDTPNLFKNTNINYYDALKNEELQKLLQNIYLPLGLYPFSIINNKFLYNKKVPMFIWCNPFTYPLHQKKTKFTHSESSNRNHYVLGNYNVKNNEIFMIDYNNFLENVEDKNKYLLDFFWIPRASKLNYTSRNKIYQEQAVIEKDIIVSDDYLFTKLFGKLKESHRDLSNIKLNNLVFSTNDPQINPFLNLQLIFNVFKTSNEFPFIKIVINNDDIKYKIYKPFIKKYGQRFLNKWNVLPKLKSPYITRNSIIFKIQINKNNYMEVTLYDNFYMVINFSMIENYVSLKSLQMHLEKYRKLIKLLKKITGSPYIDLPDTGHLFKSNILSSISSVKLISCNFMTQIDLKNSMKSQNNILDNLNKMCKCLRNYVILQKEDNTIKLIYRKVNNFENRESIKNFVIYLMNKEMGIKNQIVKRDLINRFFNITPKEANNKLLNYDPKKDKTVPNTFLYGILVKITFQKNKLNVTILDVNNINELNMIATIINALVVNVLSKSESLECGSKKVLQDVEDDFKLGRDDSDNLYDSDELIDMDMNALIDSEGIDFSDIGEDFEELQKKSEKELQKILGSQKKEVREGIEINKKGLMESNITFSLYMKRMREIYDPVLFEKSGKYAYNTKCGNTWMKQPYILTKEEFENIDDKESITGYIKYRNNYYICPRIWDYKANKPISVKKFINAGLKSPYSGGIPLPYDKKHKINLSDKHTVIIRKPVTSKTWSDPEKEKNWPDVLKNTGKDAYPYFLDPRKHYKKLCSPCCGITPPINYNKDSKEIQRFNKFSDKLKTCEEKEEIDNDTKYTDKKVGIDKRSIRDKKCKYDEYIKTGTTILENCRLGLLPEEIDLILQNNSEIFRISNYKLREKSNCFLRRGIIQDHNSFLRCIASVKNKGIPYNSLIYQIVHNLAIEEFITLNNGYLIDIFSNPENLPTNKNSNLSFIKFIKKNKLFMKIYKLERTNLLKLQDHKNFNKVPKNTLYKIIAAYKAYTAYINFLRYCSDKNIYKRPEFFMDLLSRSNDWLFKTGVNIVIFDILTGNIVCNPYLKKYNKNIILLIKHTPSRYEPIVHVITKYSSVQPIIRGVIPLDDTINLSPQQYTYLDKYVSNKELIKKCQNRLPYLNKLVAIHLHLCKNRFNDSLKINSGILPNPYEVITFLMKLIKNKELEEEYKPVAQVTTLNSHTIYIKTFNQILIPTYPGSIFIGLPIILESNIEKYLRKDIGKYIEQLIILDRKTNGTLLIAPTKLISRKNRNKSEEPKMVYGIMTKSNIIIPTKGIPLHNIKSKYPIVEKNIYIGINIVDESKDIRVSEVDRITYMDNLYQQFKYEVMLRLNLSKNKKNKNAIIKILKVALFDDNYERVKKIQNKIDKIMAHTVANFTTNESINNKISGFRNTEQKLGKCEDISISKCEKNSFCVIKNNKCLINLNKELYNRYLQKLTEELLYNIITRRKIIEGTFIPDFYIQRDLIHREDEIVVSKNNFNTIWDVMDMSNYTTSAEIYDIIQPSNVVAEGNNIVKPTIQEFNNIKGNVTFSDSDVDILKNIFKKDKPDQITEKNIIATIFDKNGKLRKNMKAGPCIFPYVYGNQKRLKYNCNSDSNKGLRCPTAIDNIGKPVHWGFCPIDPQKTNKRLGVKNIHAVGIKDRNLYKGGKCIFPFRNNFSLNWDCIPTRTKGIKWCATDLVKGKPLVKKLPIAAEKEDDIWYQNWKWYQLYSKEDKNKIDHNVLKVKARGKCIEDIQVEGKKIKKVVLKKRDKVFKILTLDNYDILKCYTTPSKGGYIKPQLFHFGTNVLNIPPNVLLEKKNKIKKKSYISKIITKKFIEIKRSIIKKPEDLLDIYTKDIDKCISGEGGGGYFLTDLRNMAIVYFGLDIQTGINADKDFLCNYISPIIKDLQKKIKKKDKKKKTVSSLYKKNINKCKSVPSEGGYDMKILQDIADKVGIDAKGLKKEILCNQINQKFKNEKKGNKIGKRKVKLTKKRSSLLTRKLFPNVKKTKKSRK